ncbi:MAG: MarC family protein [Dehalococcoidia bacterium]|nr:MarC family protein [Dehalococcoidia bacterium]
MLDFLAGIGQPLLLSAIPIFVAIDPVGTLSFLLGLTQGMSSRERSRVTRFAILTALGLGLGFLAVGQLVFSLLGITQASFLVAGGVLLFILTTNDIVRGVSIPREAQPRQDEYVGVVPLGTPLVVGPAVLATLLLLVQRYHIAVVVAAFMLNLGLTWLVFAQADRITRVLGRAGLMVVAKIAGLLLAAIAVDMVRRGIMQFLTP